MRFPMPPSLDGIPIPDKLRQVLQRWMSDLRLWAAGISGGGTLTSVTATSPIVVTPSPIVGVGDISHAVSGVTAATYGDGTHYPVIAVDADGHITLASNQALAAGATITVQDEGVTQSTGVTTLNFVGAAVAASGAGATETITVTAATSPLSTKGDLWGFSTVDARLPVGTVNGQVLNVDSTAALGVAYATFASYGPQLLFGDGSDGNVTISSGVTTLTRDMYYNNLTISGTGQLNVAGFNVRVMGILDITASPADGITYNGAAGSNAATSTGGAKGTQPGGNQLAIGTSGTAGASGTLGGTGSASANVAAVSPGMGGGGGRGGQSQAAGAGVAAGAVSAITQWTKYPRFAGAFPIAFEWNVVSGNPSAPVNNITFAGQGGSGGASGGQFGGGTGGGGGGGGAGGNTVSIYARTINRGGSTAVGAISAKGGKGGVGGLGVLGGGTGSEGGGGGGGGGGGWIWIVFEYLTGTAATNALDASGGAGDAGGNGVGTGAAAVGGDAGSGGKGGFIYAYNLIAGTTTVVSSHTAGSAGAAGSGITGGTPGGAGGACQSNL